MRVWLGRLILLSALAVAIFFAWKWLFPGPEQIIRKRLAELAAAASIASNEAPLVRLAKAQKLATFFSPDVQVTVDVPGRSVQTFSGREEVQQAALGARAILGNLKVEFLDILVTVAPDKESAVARLTATAKLPGERIPEVQELQMAFKKLDHEWLIRQVDSVKTLR